MNQLKIFSTALLLISMLVTTYGQDGLKYYNEGVDLKEKGEFQKGIETFSRGIEENVLTRSLNYYGRAYCYYELKQFKKAKTDIENSLKTKAINNEGINSDIYYLKGLIASAEGDRQLEIESYKKAIDYAPKNLLIKITLGLALVDNNEPQKALEILNSVIEKNNKYAYAYNNRALALIKLGKLDMAKSDLDESKKLDSQNPFLYRNYFFYFQAKKEKENACQSIVEALKMDMPAYGEDKDTKELKKLKRKFCH